MIRAFRMLMWMTVLTGVVYPLLITGIVHLTIPKKGRGSMILHQGKIVGSSLIGQKFTNPRYFWPRPSASDYSALPGRGSNLGPTSAKLKQLVAERKQALEVYGKDIPSDLLFASGSGLDPHITPPAANFQIERIAKERGIASQQLTKLIDAHTTRRRFNFFGTEYVNVLMLNIALDQMEEEKP